MLEPVAPLLAAPPLVRYGLPEFTRPDSPAVATAFSASVDGHDYLRLISVFCRLVTDANAANREVVLEYQDAAANRYAVHGSAVTQAASLTRDYYFGALVPSVVTLVDGSHVIPLSPHLLPPTHKWLISVVNVQAGDQLSRVRVVQERFYTTNQPPTEFPV